MCAWVYASQWFLLRIAMTELGCCMGEKAATARCIWQACAGTNRERALRVRKGRVFHRWQGPARKARVIHVVCTVDLVSFARDTERALETDAGVWTTFQGLSCRHDLTLSKKNWPCAFVQVEMSAFNEHFQRPCFLNFPVPLSYHRIFTMILFALRQIVGI